MNSHTDKTPIRRAGRHAIVIGGSMAGLIAARVLLDHYEEVTILESDRYPGGPTSRSGVPQARHVHVLMLRGQAILEQLFPGIRADLIAADAQLVDMAGDVEWLTPAGRGLRFPSSLIMLACTRDLLEWHVRLRLATHPRIRFGEETEVTGLLLGRKHSRVVGVRARRRGLTTSPTHELDADLVVDASGRQSKTPQWLQEIGYPALEEDVVNGFLGYASRIYEAPPPDGRTWKAAFIQAAPPDVTRGGLVLPIEHNRFMVTLLGLGRDYPPVDESGFVDFAGSLRAPLIYDFVRSAQPLSAIAGARHTENRWRHYESLDRWPDGLVVLGDAACAFNPVYGQGMTTAALAAMTLHRFLTRHSRGFDEKCLGFQKRLARVNAWPWLLATSEDFRVRGTVGGSPDLRTRLMHRYMDQVIQLTTFDRNVRLAFLRVMHMLESPASLFRPSLLLQVVRHAAHSRKQWIARGQSAICATNKFAEFGKDAP